MSDPAESLSQRSLGGMVVGERLGEGGLGVVYRAEQPALGREAVIKVLHARHRRDAEPTRRFLREARLASHLDHPYAAHVYDFGVEPDGLTWIAMELVRGTPLDQLIQAHGSLPLARFAPLFDRLCEVVHSAHEQGIVHRDIKPANVMVLTRAGRWLPKLLDFGLAKSGSEGAEPGEGPGSDDLALTGADAHLGSPYYMAPEQWTHPADADGRADQYALGVLAFQALTGEVPFKGRTVMALARAHARDSLPALGPGLPTALHGVLERATAKRAGDRYPSVLELAAAFRAAAGWLDAALPQLGEALRDRLLADAPQPLAEHIALLESAPSAAEARDAVWQTFAVTVRLVALYALACRSRSGSGELASLRAIRARALDDAEWLALARDAAATTPLSPLPALAQALADDVFAPLLALRGSGELAALVAELDRLLRALAFLCDYPLCVARGGAAEAWTGVRRAHRRSLGPVDAEDGRAVLLAPDGAAVALLHPLLQVAAPSPGAPEEMFLFAGPGRYGARLVSHPAGFERQDDGLWAWFGAHLLDSGEQAPTDEAPYLGLAPFGPDDAARFVGREREVTQVVNRLRMRSLLLVVGPSGAGKSSFVHAGVVPSLPPEWRVAVMRPGATPAQTLEARLEGARPLVVVVDQLEELFTLCSDQAERLRFAERLVSPGPDVRVVATLRDDFLMRLAELPPLRTGFGDGLHLCSTPAPDELRRILVEPLARAGYRFEDDALPDEMVAEVAGHPGALSLLSFTAARAWELRDRHFRQLTRKAHASLGGVGGALARHAEATLAGLAAEEQRLVRALFRHLVTAEGTRQAATRAELVQVLGGGVRAEAVIDRLVAARLLVVSEGEGGGERIEIIHETLLAAWPRLVAWRREDHEGARLRDQLRAAARLWAERGRPRGLLWRGDALTELALWRSRHPGLSTALDDEFARASAADASRGRRLLRGLVAAAFLVLAAAAAGLAWQRGVAADAAAAEKERLLQLYEEQGRQALLADDPMRASVYLSAAYSAGRSSAGLRTLLGAALRALEPAEAAFVGHDYRVYDVAFAPDGSWLVSAGEDETARLWDLAGKRAPRVLRPDAEYLFNVSVAPDGKTLALSGKPATVWDVATGKLVARIGEGKEAFEVVFAPDGRLVVLGSDGLAVVVGETTTTLVGHTGRVWSAAFSPDGQRVATAGRDDQTIRVWEGSTEVAVVRDVKVNMLAWSDRGELLAAGDDGTLRSWSRDGAPLEVRVAGVPLVGVVTVAGGRALTFGDQGHLALWAPGSATPRCRYPGQAERVLAAAVAGELVIASGQDPLVRVWDLGSCGQIAQLAGHRGAVRKLAVHGDRAASASFDGEVRVWDLATLREARLAGPTGPLVAVRSGTRVFAAARDGGVWTWDPGPRKLADHGAPLTGMDVRGAAIVTTGEDGFLRVWDTVGGARGAGRVEQPTEGPWTPVSPAFSPDGAHIVVVARPPGAGPSQTAVERWETRDMARRAHRVSVEGGQRPSVVAFTPEGRLIAGGLEGRVTELGPDLRELGELGRHRASLVALAPAADGIYAMGAEEVVHRWAGHAQSYSPLVAPSRALAAAPPLLVTAAGTWITVWDTDSGVALGRWQGHVAQSLAFSADGARVYAAETDGVAVLRMAAVREPADTVAARVACLVPYRLEQQRLTLTRPDAPTSVDRARRCR